MDKINKQTAFEHVLNFAMYNNYGDKNVPEQLISFFTTWCVVFGIYSDTKECKDALKDIYQAGDLDEVIVYNEFESNMISHLLTSKEIESNINSLVPEIS